MSGRGPCLFPHGFLVCEGKTGGFTAVCPAGQFVSSVAFHRLCEAGSDQRFRETEAAQTSAGICRHQAPSKAARPEGQHTGDPPGSGGSRRFCRNQRQQTTIPCSRGIHPLRETDRVSVFRRPGLCAVTRREKISHTICIPAEYQITDERNIRFLRTSAAGSHLPAPCRIRRCGEGSLRNLKRQSGDGNTALHQKCLTVVFSIHLSAVGRRG